MKDIIKQTAGKEQLGTFAPDFARYNDDILFGEVWSEPIETIDKRKLHENRMIFPIGKERKLTTLNIFKEKAI